MSDIDNFGYTDMGEYLEREFPITKPRTDEEHQWEHLDGQEYHPAPHIIEDTQEGYDSDGNWHTAMGYLSGRNDPNSANMDTLNTLNTPYRHAVDIQNHVIQEVERSGFPQDQTAREDIAYYFANEVLSKTVDPPSLAYDAFHLWTRIYRRGVQGNGL